MIIDPTTVPPQINYRILVGAVVPRPIAFVSTISPEGVRNLAPFSFFNVVCGDPPVICFSPIWRNPPKDTIVNIRATGEFVVNIVSEDFADRMNICSGEYPSSVDEFSLSGLTPVESVVVRPARVKESHVNMECRLMQIVDVSARPMGGSLVIGEVVRFHVDDAVIEDFRIDADKLGAVGRMSGSDYARTRDRFSLIRPA
jgi:flavin reductase (DIM6/NTAB) family NADH-FMN oxidoreductase RutF